MTTLLYLVRHAATAANLAVPAKLQGRRTDPPLDPVGIAQAAATRLALSHVTFDAVYASPLARARQTAELIAPSMVVQSVENLTECDVGRWEGVSWEEIEANEPELFAQYHADPATTGYAGGENFAQVLERVTQAMDEIWRRHAGGTVLVVSHHVVNRVYLAAMLGLPPSQARRVSLDNTGISIVRRSGLKNQVATLNSTLHLR